jgi:predicted enzyme related to lactoylglutathione lyase
MARVLGVGGIFFKSPGPQKLNAWYSRWLGLSIGPKPGASFRPQAMPRNSYTVWSAFDARSTYFFPSDKQFMFNLVVDNLEEALQQVKEGGAQVLGDIDVYDNGRFGWFIDPDGNKVELWEPSPS